MIRIDSIRSDLPDNSIVPGVLYQSPVSAFGYTTYATQGTDDAMDLYVCVRSARLTPEVYAKIEELNALVADARGSIALVR